MDFQRLLLQIGESLGTEEVKALAFLCTDVSQRSLNSVELFSDLCSSLSDQDLLSADRPQLLQELLLTIQRHRLLRNVQLTEPGPRRDLISPYRKLLYNLSEDITDGDLRNIKFLLNQKLPRRKLDENVTTLALFLEMEQMDLLGQTNLDLLQTICDSVCPVLNEKINLFKQQQSRDINNAFDQMNSSTWKFYDQNQHNDPRSLLGGSSSSGVQFFPQASVSPPNASIDFPNGLQSQNHSNVLPQSVSDAKAVTNIKGTSNASTEITEIPRKPVLNVGIKFRNVEELQTYAMASDVRGVCLIVNNYNFIDKGKREGTNIDQECLERVFQWLGFKVEVHHDCTGEKMLTVAKELSLGDHRNMDCVVCCFLSHGKEGCIFGVDDETVSIREITTLFNGSRCPSLVDKPKMFFIQACQGVNKQQAVRIQTDGPAPCCIESDAAKLEESLPSESDFLLGMATVPSFVSYRDLSRGTWFIQALCKNLIQMVPRGVDLLSILTKVNDDVSSKEPKKQMPQPAFSLRKKLIFPVPSDPPPNLCQ